MIVQRRVQDVLTGDLIVESPAFLAGCDAVWRVVSVSERYDTHPRHFELHLEPARERADISGKHVLTLLPSDTVSVIEIPQSLQPEPHT